MKLFLPKKLKFKFYFFDNIWKNYDRTKNIEFNKKIVATKKTKN